MRCGGRAGSPVRIAADPPGSAIITAAAEPETLNSADWRDDAGGLFSTKVNWPVHLVLSHQRSLYRVPGGGVAQLRRLADRPHCQGAFCVEEGRLHIALPAGQAPQDAQITWHQHVPPPREWGEFKSANLWIEADHLVLSGLRLEFGLGAAIRVWNGEHIEIEDCEFSGCSVGVLAGGGQKPSRHLSVERCWYHNSPQADWLRGWLTWEEVYAAYSSSTLCSAADLPVSIRSNLVTDFGDGLRISPRKSADQIGIAEIEGNWLAFGTDDAFELDGEGHQVAIRNNLVIDVHEGISLSPVSEGPVTISHNLFWNPSGGLNGSQIKLIPPGSWPGDASRIHGVRINENLFLGEWLSWRSDVTVSDFDLEHNYFEVDRQLSPPWPEGLRESDNHYRTRCAQDEETVEGFLERLGSDESTGKFHELAGLTVAGLTVKPGPRWLDWNTNEGTRRLQRLVRRTR